MSIDRLRGGLGSIAGLFLVAAALWLTASVFDPTSALAAPSSEQVSAQNAQYQSGDASELMLDEPVDELPVVDDARWSSEWTERTPVAMAVWVALLIILSIAGRSWARLLLGSFPDAGQGFARLLLLLPAAWGVWFAASYEVIAFRAIWAWYAVIAVAVVGWLLATSRINRSASQPTRRAIGGAEAAFWIVFALFLVLRFFNPDSWHPIWGGEKPMEFAHINALLRTPSFPPFDPWFSGESSTITTMASTWSRF